MKKITICLLFLTLIFFSQTIKSQSKYTPLPTTADTYKVTSTVNLEYKYVPSINELINKQTFIPSDPDLYKIKREDKKMRGNKVVPGKGLPKGPDPLISLGSKNNKKQNREPILDFLTTSNTATPGDPTGEVGRDYYITAWNSSFRIYNLDLGFRS